MRECEEGSVEGLAAHFMWMSRDQVVETMSRTSAAEVGQDPVVDAARIGKCRASIKSSSS